MGNIENFLVRLAGILKEKYHDKELSEYVMALNVIFLKNALPRETDAQAQKLNGDFQRNYLKEWEK